MENLGLSKDEVMHTPYKLLLMMQHDKLRADYSGDSEEETKEISGKEMLARKRGKGA